jgi:hypothetical protein
VGNPAAVEMHLLEPRSFAEALHSNPHQCSSVSPYEAFAVRAVTQYGRLIETIGQTTFDLAQNLIEGCGAASRPNARSVSVESVNALDLAKL